MQFLVIAPDHTDAEAPQRRQATRQAHLDYIKARTPDTFLYGAALLNETGQMSGSVFVCQFADARGVQAWLAEEPYVLANVWNRDAITVQPVAVAPIFARAAAL